MRINGFTLPELLIAIAIAGMVLAIGVPALQNALADSRLDAAANALVSDIREARSKAVATGWEHRVIGFDGASTTFANSYRVLSRQSSAIGWPADTDAAFTSSTASAGAWTDVSRQYPGIGLSAATPSRFELTFDSRGGASGAAANFNSLTIAQSDGRTRSLTVSIVGSVTVQ